MSVIRAWGEQVGERGALDIERHREGRTFWRTSQERICGLFSRWDDPFSWHRQDDPRINTEWRVVPSGNKN